MTNITIQTIDLQALLDVVEGYSSENGVDSVGRYAAPEAVQLAIVNTKAAISSNGYPVQSTVAGLDNAR